MRDLFSFLVLTVFLSLVPMPGAVLAHCEIPCGIYDDPLRFELMREDAGTIEKGMKQIAALSADPAANANQLIRWVMNKDEHADRIKETVADYFLSQRVPLPTGEDPRARDVYFDQLRLLHRITVLAMKCKQSTDLKEAEALKSAINAYEELYRSIHGHPHA